MSIDNSSIEKMLDIITYDFNEGRPNDICHELYNKYKEKFSGTLYHGFSDFKHHDINDLNNILSGYVGFVSCSDKFVVAFDFAQSRTEEDTENGVIFKINLENVEVLKVSEFIVECFHQNPKMEICKYMYMNFAGEHEYLILAEDMVSNISSIEIINNKSELKEYQKYFTS